MRHTDKFVAKFFLVFLAASLAACSSTRKDAEEESIPSYEQLRAISKERVTGSIYRSGTEQALFEDVKASRIGDILTVFLVEETSGQNSMDNNINQSTGLNLDTPIFGGLSKPDFNYEVGAESSFEGQSGSSQSNRLNGSIAVTVHEVLPNGNLVVAGEKWIRINKANEYIKLEGVIRPKDIGSDNALYSTQIADARISYGGKGVNSQSNSPGWVSRILFSPIWPF
jgi:flagellar L-ring protein precursor FlgH